MPQISWNNDDVNDGQLELMILFAHLYHKIEFSKATADLHTRESYQSMLPYYEHDTITYIDELLVCGCYESRFHHAIPGIGEGYFAVNKT